MLKFPPSMLAVSVIFTVQCTLGKVTQWSKTNGRHTNYKDHELMECSKLMVEFHHKAAIWRLTDVYRKYNTSKYGYVARTEPAHFLLDFSFRSVTHSIDGVAGFLFYRANDHSCLLRY